jgi:hypothetical protein
MLRHAWRNWLRRVLVGAMAVGYGAAGLLLGNAALRRPLLPLWGRMLIGAAALGALLTSLLALQAALEARGLRASNRPDGAADASGNAHKRSTSPQPPPPHDDSSDEPIQF